MIEIMAALTASLASVFVLLKGYALARSLI